MIKFLDLQKISDSFQPELTQVVNNVVKSGWYLRGEETKAFENAFAAYCGAENCVGVANGLDALYLVLEAEKQMNNNWADGDEVILPAMTFIATAQAVVRAGLKPVFVDVDENAIIATELIEKAITQRTRAIIPVHLYGQVCDISAITRIAAQHGLFVLEDAAQAHGAFTMEGAIPEIGTKQDITTLTNHRRTAAFSFYPGKNLGALGDGGAVVTQDRILAERVRNLANYGSSEKYKHTYPGCNSRLDEIQAAVLHLKLRRLDNDNQRRKAIAQYYINNINNSKLRTLSIDVNSSVWHIFPVFTEDRDALARYLSEHGVQSIVHYPIPVHKQPSMKAYADESSANLINAEKIAQQELSIPISPVMTDAECEEVVKLLNRY